MKRVISISEIVTPLQLEGESCEVWASAEANYDEVNLELDVRLEAFLRRSKDNKHLPTRWLPPPENLREHVDFEEASSAAKEIFENWVHRIRRAMEARSDATASPPRGGNLSSVP